MTLSSIVPFVTGSLFIIWFSWWASIKEKRYHGLYRFFSFESILVLVILNWRYWFRTPLSINQCFAWLLLLISLYLAFTGFLQLVKRGKPEGRFENTSILITSGLYNYIRHPLYCSLLLLGTGIWLKDPAGIYSIIAGSINAVAIYFTAREEEREMIKRFGEEYKQYMKRSRMFIPYLF